MGKRQYFEMSGRFEFNDDGDPMIVRAEDDDCVYEWVYSDVCLADSRRMRDITDAIILTAKMDPEGQVVRIFNGSSDYIFANTALANVREK